MKKKWTKKESAQEKSNKKSRAKAGATKGFFLMWKYNLSDAVPHDDDFLGAFAVRHFRMEDVRLLDELTDVGLQ